MKYNREYRDSLPKFDKGVSLLCWAYNEEMLIGDFIEKANKLLEQAIEDYEIVIVDDGSTDKTAEIIESKQKFIPRLRLIRNPVNMNVGYSSQRAIKNAQKEYLFWQTIDWSYDLSNLRMFLELLKSYDIVEGVRKGPITSLLDIDHLSRRSDNLFKAMVSVINYILIRCLFRVPLSDYQNVSFYPSKLIQSVSFESNSSFSNPEGLIKSHWKGASIIEVPIPFMHRQIGSAKGTRPKAILKAVRDIFQLWFQWIILGKRGLVKKGQITRLNPAEWAN